MAKRTADPVASDKPSKKAKTNESCEPAGGEKHTTPGWWWRLNVKAMLTPWRWFQRSAASPPQTLVLAGCCTAPQLNGVYNCDGNAHAEELDHSRSTYEKEGGDFFCYFWCDPNDEPSNGWYVADEVASEDYLAFNPARTMAPPEGGWVVDGQGSLCALTPWVKK